jgi:quercetin dioxygenase-like cupin family protein
VLILAGWVVSAQQPTASRAPTPVTTNFTGTVANLDAADVRAVRFQYAAGARSYWHSHAGIQVLTLESGRGRAQVQNQKMQELLPGQPVLLPAGIPHWHGAAPDQGLVQIATTLGAATWMAPVSDDEYQGRK